MLNTGSKKTSWQDNSKMKDSDMVRKWTELLNTVENAVKGLEEQKSVLLEKQKGMETSKDMNNG
tara:strand:- start:204 stop:395 length:192 start_codon:yes stop_codon:yes gene_type:complete